MVFLTFVWHVRETLTGQFLKVETLTDHQNEQIYSILRQNFHHCKVQYLA